MGQRHGGKTGGRRWLRYLGLAGLASVAAGGVVGGVAVAREQRRRNAYTPEQIRDRLRARVQGEASSDAD